MWDARLPLYVPSPLEPRAGDTYSSAIQYSVHDASFSVVCRDSVSPVRGCISTQRQSSRISLTSSSTLHAGKVFF